MAPIRRYLRITKYSVLEVRIYLESPSLAETWLLRPNNPALTRVIEAVRPLVLPKLREENERARSKGKGKKGARDVVSGDDFEVSIYLTELSSRHSLLTKQKHFEDKARLRSNSGKLTGWLTTGTKERPHEVADDDAPAVLREEDDDEPIDLDAVPDAGRRSAEGDGAGATPSGLHKRRRRDSDEALFVAQSSDEDEAFQAQRTPPPKRTRRRIGAEAASESSTACGQDDEKKLSLRTAYDGFSIYGRVLCLIVRRKGPARARLEGGHANVSSQQMMENWVSTQAVRDRAGDDGDGDDEGEAGG